MLNIGQSAILSIQDRIQHRFRLFHFVFQLAIECAILICELAYCTDVAIYSKYCRITTLAGTLPRVDSEVQLVSV